MNIDIHISWQKALGGDLDQLYFVDIMEQVHREYEQYVVFPEKKDIFRAFQLTPFEDVRVVILGQDPYHTPEVADGLAFSSKNDNRVPPSLRNIYTEIVQEFGIHNYPLQNNPDLTRWAQQGVLLLNNTLTVRAHEPNSHKHIGWGTFTDRVIQTLASQKTHLVFILWGKFAQSKRPLIEQSPNQHMILESPHPSPFSAHKGFFGNYHFVTCNEYLFEHNIQEIDW